MKRYRITGTVNKTFFLLLKNSAPLMSLICLYLCGCPTVLLLVPVEFSCLLKSTLCSSDHFKLSIDKIKLDS